MRRPVDDSSSQLRFGAFTVEWASGELRRDGVRVHVAEKPLRVLQVLLECPGEIVARDELCRRLWRDGTFVDFDNNLNTAIATLREALGDSARAPRWIETLPRRGYRFIGSVRGADRTEHVPHWLKIAVAAFMLAGSEASVAPRAQPVLPGASPTLSLAYEDGIYLLARGDRQSLERAITRLETAVAEHPRHAPAAAALGEAWLRTALGTPHHASSFAYAEHWARRALELDPALSAPRRTLAGLHLHRDWNFAAAAREITDATEEDPGDAETHLVAAIVSAAQGRSADALRAARRAVTLAPADTRVRADLAFFLLAAGRPDEAAVESQRVLHISPDFAPALDFLLVASERLGHLDVARSAALRLMALADAPAIERKRVERARAQDAVGLYRRWQIRCLEASAEERRWSPMTRASIYASAGDTAQAIEWLERAYATRDTMLVLLLAQPDLAPLRKHPRFAVLARRLGVPLVAS